MPYKYLERFKSIFWEILTVARVRVPSANKAYTAYRACGWTPVAVPAFFSLMRVSEFRTGNADV